MSEGNVHPVKVEAPSPTPSQAVGPITASTNAPDVMDAAFMRDMTLANAQPLLKAHNPDWYRFHSQALPLSLIVMQNEQGYGAVVLHGRRPEIEGARAPSIHEALNLMLQHTARALSEVYNGQWERRDHIQTRGGTRFISEHDIDYQPTAAKQTGQRVGRVEAGGPGAVGRDIGKGFGGTRQA